MYKLYKRLTNRIKSDNRGSAIVIVILALAFVGILGATIMWMSLSNFRMKVTDQENKQSFYTAETIFDQIQVGLQADASEAADYAWSYVLQNYNNLPTDADKQGKFINEFRSNLNKILSNGSGSMGKYNISHISGYIDPSIGISTNVSNKGNPIRFLGVLAGTTPDIILPTDKDYIMLKNLELEYTDDNGYYSVISTDIMISAPSIVFAKAGGKTELFKFALVGNKGIDVTTGQMNVKGSIYAGEDGILCNNMLKISDANYVVSKGPVVLNNAVSDLTIQQFVDVDNNLTQFYSEDIIINGAKLDVFANTRVADDLTLNENGSEAVLKGTYAGYGHSLSSNDSSSAIIVNGLNSGLNMSALNNVLLAGHSFVGTSKASMIDTPTSDSDSLSGNNIDIMMGESVSVKGNQLAYLVPDECIGVYKHKTVVGKNPLTGTEYAKLANDYHYNPITGAWDADFELVSFDKSIAAFGNQTLGNYTNNIQMIFAPSNGETLVYFYLVFDDKDKANAFFKEYYGNHKDRMEAYFNAYARKGITMPNVDNTKVQGNYVTGTAGSPGVFTVSDLNDPNPTNATKLADLCNNYAEIAAALNAKLIINYNGLSNDERSKSVYDNLINTSVFDSKISGTKVFTTPGGIKAILTDVASYEFTGDPNVRIIIAKNDVEVKGNYTGLIIAGGKIIESNGITVTSAEAASAAVLTEIKEVFVQEIDIDGLGTMMRPADFVTDGDVYVSSSGTSGSSTGKGRADLSKIIQYQNWIKK